MKTAVSLPDKLFEEAENAARTLRVSRSQLYARALAEFLNQRRPEGVTAKLNELYKDAPASVPPALDRAQRRALPKESW